jgi:hypothetical protein
MAFRGIYPAPDLTPAPCGLLSVARVMSHGGADYDERWVRGFSYEFDSQPEVEIFTVNDATVTGGVQLELQLFLSLRNTILSLSK